MRVNIINSSSNTNFNKYLTKCNRPKPHSIKLDNISFKAKNDSTNDKIQFKLNHFVPELRSYQAYRIYNAYGINLQLTKDGKIILDEFRQPDENTSFADLGINETHLLEDVIKIKGDADFRYSKATKLCNIKKIGGSANFEDSRISNLGELEYIGNNANFEHSKVVNMGKLNYIGGDGKFSYSKIEDLGELTEIGKNADFSYSSEKNLGNLKIINKNADFRNSPVRTLSKVEYIGGNLHCEK